MEPETLGVGLCHLWLNKSESRCTLMFDNHWLKLWLGFLQMRRNGTSRAQIQENSRSCRELEMTRVCSTCRQQVGKRMGDVLWAANWRPSTLFQNVPRRWLDYNNVSRSNTYDPSLYAILQRQSKNQTCPFSAWILGPHTGHSPYPICLLDI